MPMKLTSGCSVAETMRKRPLPEPISSTTRRSLPNSAARSRRTSPASRGLMTSCSSLTASNDRRSSAPQRRSLHHAADVVHQRRIAPQPRADPAHEADVLIGEVALLAEMVEPAVGIAVKDADQYLVTEEICRF